MGEFAVYEEFSPQEYLHSYYGELQSEAGGLLSFLVERFKSLPNDLQILEFGAGPTLIGLIPAARRAANVHFCDYVAANRDVIQRWVSGDESDFDWSPYIAHCLLLEGDESTSIEDRAETIRKVVSEISSCDIYASPPVISSRQYDVVISNYCLDAVTNNKNEWISHIQNLKQMLLPGGMFIFSSLEEARFSDFGDTRFPNVYLKPEDVREALLEAGFQTDSIIVETAPADHDEREYHGVIFGSAIC